MSCGWNGNSEVLVQNFEYLYCIANALHGKLWYICLKCYYGIPAHPVHSGLFLIPREGKGRAKHFINLEYNPKTLVGLSRGRYGFAFILCKNTFQLVKFSSYFIFLWSKDFVTILFHYFSSSVSLLQKFENLWIFQSKNVSKTLINLRHFGEGREEGKEDKEKKENCSKLLTHFV